jgi:HK97 family phage major capsid protein
MMSLTAFIGVFLMGKYVELLQDVGAWSKGEIPGAAVDDAFATAMIQSGQAREVDGMAFLSRSIQSEMKKTKDELMEVARAGFSPPGPPVKAPRPPGGGLEVKEEARIEGSEPAGKRGIGECLRAVYCVQAQGTPPELRDWGQSLLDKVYSDQRVSYKVVDGELAQTIERGGQSVTRTGTESISGGPSYGFLVKPQWTTDIFRIPIEESVLEGKGTTDVPVGDALEFKWPAWQQYKTPVPGQAAAYAGFVLGRKGEITKRDYSDGQVAEIDFKVSDLTAFSTISRDLSADAFVRVEAQIQQMLGDAFQWKKDYEFINGNGAGMPQGFLALNCPGVLTVSRKKPSQIVLEDLIGMTQNMMAASWNEMYWIAHQTTISQLWVINNNAGQMVYQPNALLGQWMRPSITGEGQPYNNRTFRAQGTLLGLPFCITEKVPSLGNRGDLTLLFPRMYGIAARAGLEVGLSEHFLFDTDQIAFRWKLRNDAHPMMLGPYIQSDGGVATGNTKVSWCSVLV